MDPMMSLFVDDELSMDEKTELVSKLCCDKEFRNGLLSLLHQEKLLRSNVVDWVPDIAFAKAKKSFYFLLRPLQILAPALAAALLVFFFMPAPKERALIPYRFVIYQPDARQVAITGNFTEWQTVPMNRSGTGEYWEITLNLPKGEHRFTYILDGHQRFADPTVPSREQDDYGGENSILLVSI